MRAPLLALVLVLEAGAFPRGATGATADPAVVAAPADTNGVATAADTAGRAPADTTIARSSPAPPTLDRYLRALADSTDRRYGRVAAPIDTVGLDSALVSALLTGDEPRRPIPFGLLPWFDFNRVDAALYGASARVGSPRRMGAVGGRLGWAAGPDEVRGAVTLERVWGSRRSGALWEMRAWAGRASDPLDADQNRSLIGTLRALVFGNDLDDYLRRDGVRLRGIRESATLRLSLAARDQLESPQGTASTWTLFGARVQRVGNVPATLRRIREVEAEGTWRVPKLPLWVEGEWRVSDGAFGSDADYRRTRLAAALQVPLARVATVVTQGTWGRTDGELMPQNAQWIGGRRTLRSVPLPVAGSGRALGRIEVVGAPDLLGWMPPDRRAPVNLQLGVFAETGGVFGTDAITGASWGGTRWPVRDRWLSEAGIAFLYRTGLPDPRYYYRFDLTRVLGPRPGGWGWRFFVSTPIEMLRPVDR